MRRNLMALASLVVLVGIASARPAPGFFVPPPVQSIPQRVLTADTIVAGKVTAVADKSTKAERFKGDVQKGEYRIFTVKCREAIAGWVVVVEEIGKHRPITFAVAITPEGAVHDLAVLAYREAYGGEVRERRFLRQYVRKTLADPLVPYRDVRNISGATLSVEATGRAARKAIAVLKVAGALA